MRGNKSPVKDVVIGDAIVGVLSNIRQARAVGWTMHRRRHVTAIDGIPIHVGGPIGRVLHIVGVVFAEYGICGVHHTELQEGA